MLSDGLDCHVTFGSMYLKSIVYFSEFLLNENNIGHQKKKTQKKKPETYDSYEDVLLKT